MRTRSAVLTVLCLALTAQPAYAWGRDGHRIVCRIAWQLLDQTRRDEITRLIASYRDPDGRPLESFWLSCSFADEVRSRARTGSADWMRFRDLEPWHYLNVPRSTTRIPDPPCPGNCVATAVGIHLDSLRHGPGDRTRTEALLFLAHWIGDLHQPLHVSYADDRGGNDIRPIEGNYYSSSNMHALWDTDLLARGSGDRSWEAVADSLARDATPAQQVSWTASSPLAWAQESYDLVTSPATQYCDWTLADGAWTCAQRNGARTLSGEYQARFAPEVLRRLQTAGVRLAGVLRDGLKGP